MFEYNEKENYLCIYQWRGIKCGNKLKGKQCEWRVLGNHYRLVENNTFPEPWVEDRNDSGQIQLNNFPNSRDSVSGSDYDH